MHRGYIKLHRKIIEWEWYKNHVTKTLFLHLVLIANHQPKKWQGKIVDIGETITSVNNLSTALGLSTQQIRSAIKKLKSTQEITTKTTNKHTVVTICKYSTYMHNENTEQQTNNKQITNEQQTNNKQITTNKNVKNEKNEKKKEKNVLIISSEKLIKSTNDIKEIFEHYQNAGLIKHQKLTESMRIAIKKFIKNTGSDKSVCCQVVDRHKTKVDETKNTTYRVNPRPIVELFGQKIYGGTQLIGEQYLQGGKYANNNKPHKHVAYMTQNERDEYYANYEKNKTNTGLQSTHSSKEA